MTDGIFEYDPTSNLEALHFSDDLRFGVDSTIAIGDRIHEDWRLGLDIRVKGDQTLVSKTEIDTNIWFNDQANQRYGGRAAVKGEEVPMAATAPPEPGEPMRIWTLDTGDGSGELAATHRDRNTGDPISPKRPVPANADPELILESERTTCTGLGLIKDGKVWSGVAYNPFKKRLVVADRDLGGTFLVDLDDMQADGTALGRRLEVSEAPLMPGNTPWDHATWDGGAIDVQLLQQALKTPPLNHYSAIDQAVEVALGNSDGAVFAGDTLHDIVPSLAIVHFAGGVVFGINGELIDPNNFSTEPPAGIAYTNRVNYLAFMRALQTGETESPLNTICVADYDGERFAVTLGDFFGGVLLRQSSNKIVDYGHEEGQVQPDKIVVKGFGYQRGDYISRREARQLRRLTQEMGGPKWTYKNELHVNGLMMIGTARVPHPEQSVTFDTTDGEQVTTTAGDLVLNALRMAVSQKIRHAAARRQQQALAR